MSERVVDHKERRSIGLEVVNGRNFFYGNSESDRSIIRISKQALSKLTEDNNRDYETSGFLVGYVRDHGIDFEAYVPERNVKRRRKRLGTKDTEIQALALNKRGGYTAIAAVHLHPRVGEGVKYNRDSVYESSFLENSAFYEDVLGTPDRRASRYFINYTSERGLQRPLVGIVKRFLYTDADPESKDANSKVEIGFGLTLFDSQKLRKVGGITLYDMDTTEGPALFGPQLSKIKRNGEDINFRLGSVKDSLRDSFRNALKKKEIYVEDIKPIILPIELEVEAEEKANFWYVGLSKSDRGYVRIESKTIDNNNVKLRFQLREGASEQLKRSILEIKKELKDSYSGKYEDQK